MKRVFADADYLIALLNPREQLHPKAKAASQVLGQARIVTSEMVLTEVLAFYRQHTDTSWSLTDCGSFLIMREAGLSEALTHDHHFEQAGFKALLRDEP